MKDYYFKVWFADRSFDWYPATASNINSALEEALTNAEQNAIKNNTVICDYVLDWVNN